jgi:hypothetical protein
LVDLPGAIITSGVAAGLQPVQRCVALLAAVRNGRLAPRHSFYQLTLVREARRSGVPLHLIAREDLLVLRRLGSPGSSPEHDCSQPEPRDAPHHQRRASTHAREPA